MNFLYAEKNTLRGNLSNPSIAEGTPACHNHISTPRCVYLTHSVICDRFVSANLSKLAGHQSSACSIGSGFGSGYRAASLTCWRYEGWSFLAWTNDTPGHLKNPDSIAVIGNFRPPRVCLSCNRCAFFGGAFSLERGESERCVSTPPPFERWVEQRL
jgi:hypothetical protein